MSKANVVLGLVAVLATAFALIYIIFFTLKFLLTLFQFQLL